MRYIDNSFSKKTCIERAKKVFDTEIESLVKMKNTLDDTFATIVDRVTNCQGKIVFCAIGKTGHVASKLAATFSSLGTPSFFLHPAEAMHGDLGMIAADDVVILMSYSGESDEVISIIPAIKLIGAYIIAITSNAKSTLAKNADLTQVLPLFNEACNLGLAPTSSTTVEMCYGDAIAIVASEIYGFSNKDFGKIHPAGSLGKKLILKVRDLMHKGDETAIVYEHASIKDAIIELNKKGLGAVTVIDKDNKIKGILTDGDLRRQLEKGVDIYQKLVIDIMTKDPIVISEEKLAIDALTMMKNNNISCLLVTTDNKTKGMISIHDIIGAGIIG